MVVIENLCVTLFLPIMRFEFLKETDCTNGENQTETCQDNEDMENDKNYDTKGKKIFIHTFLIFIKNYFTILIANQ